MPNPTPRSLEELVRYQVQRWQAEQKRRPRQPRPCVALSRLPGSGAAAIGLRVADELGFDFFGIELVDEIARQAHVRRHLVESLDEHLRDATERFVVDGFRKGRFRESDYLRALVRTLTSLSQRGGSVILGRGSPYVMPAERTLRVLVVAPTENRVQATASARRLGLEAARTALETEDTTRRRFLSHHFDVDPDDPLLYDLVLNTGTLATASAAALIVQAVQQRFPDAELDRARGRSVPVQLSA